MFSLRLARGAIILTGPSLVRLVDEEDIVKRASAGINLHSRILE